MVHLFDRAAVRLRSRWRDGHSRARWRDEGGAVTVDWVVLTAAIIGIAVGAVLQVSDATDVLATSISDGVSSKPVD